MADLDERKFARMIGLLILEARERKGLSQEGAANVIGCSRRYLGRIESGQATKLSLWMARRITIKLAITLDCLESSDSVKGPND